MPEVIIIQPTKAQLPKKLRMAAYARVSTDSLDQKNSFLTQMDYYTKQINSDPDKTFVDMYADEGITGTKMDKRDEFNRMLEDCRLGKIDCIITKSVSRFARNTADCINIVRELKSIGVNVIFEENGIDTRLLAGETELIALSSLAQEESMSISKNVTMGNRIRMANGTYKQGTAPYGFTIVNGKFIINEKQAEIVRLIFMAYKEGKSLLCIADELTEMGIPKSNGKTNWSPNLIRYILTNVRYKGDALHQKTFTTGFPYKQVKNRGERDMYYYKNANPAIVPRELFDTVNRLLAQQASHYNSGRESQDYPLSRMIYCAQCGTLYRRKEGTVRTYWVCREHDINLARCTNTQIDEELIYDGFVQTVNRLVKNKDYILGQMPESLKAAKQNRIQQMTEVHHITAEIAKLTEQVLVINRLKSQGYMESALCIEKLTEINGRIMQLQKEKKTLFGKDACDLAIKKTENIIRTIEQSGSIYSFQETLFKNLVQKVTADAKRLTFTLPNGLQLPVEMGV